MHSSAQLKAISDEIDQFIRRYLHQHGRAPSHRTITVQTGHSRWMVVRATARLQGQQRLHDGSTQPVLSLEDVG